MFTGLFGFFTAKIIAKIILKLSSRRAILVAVPFTMGGGTLIALAQNSFIFYWINLPWFRKFPDSYSG